MPRPQRIEYENAFYHVMNRGRGRQVIFHDSRYFEAFFTTLEEAQKRFKCVIHAYCLMSNHYHLLLETPNANLGRIMRHINGVYTQRYNRLKRTDGPLFRGRYKAILVERDTYLLQLSRYIHRNPIDMKRPLVEDLKDYPWSSYPAFIGKAKVSGWLNRELSYSLLGHKQRYRGYANYTLQGTDEETQNVYEKGNLPAILGGEGFKEWVCEDLLPDLDWEEKGRAMLHEITLPEVVAAVAHHFGCTKGKITNVVKGPQQENQARKIAMYLCQELAQAKLEDIASVFQLTSSGSVSFITHQIRKKKAEDKKLCRELELLTISIVKQVT